MDSTDGTDDFDLLGKAVARVLRDALASASEIRKQAATEQAEGGRQFTEELSRVLAEVRELPSRVGQTQAASAGAFQATLDEARRSVDELLASAKADADFLRAQAVTDAKAIVEGGWAEVARAKELVAEERVKLDGELKDLLRSVRRAVNALEASARSDHEALLDRASSEARMILRQARLHHRSTAREVDRMIEAAAGEAAALRKSALTDAARVAARVRGVVDYPTDAEDELRPPAWVRPNRPAPPEEDPLAKVETPPEQTPGHTRRKLRPLAS